MGFTVVRVFADEVKTGKTDKRLEFQKLVRSVEAGKCHVVLAYKSNRIARNMLQALTYENKFEQAGVRIIYAKEEFGDNAAGRFALRHSCASLLLANGVPMKQIQEWLGHSDFSTTANIYAHLDYSSKLTSADAMLNGLGLAPN